LPRTAAACQNPTLALQQTPLLFNDFIGAGEQRKRDGEAERLGGLEVENEVNPRDL
jgi:hypothetical protein